MPIRAPLALPQFTFLCGPPTYGQAELAEALLTQDLGLMEEKFQSTIDDAIKQLLTGNCWSMSRDPIKLPGTWPLEKWQVELKEVVARALGDTGLAQLAIARFDEEALWPRMVFSDCHDANLIRPFVEKYGNEACLQIHFSVNSWPLEHVRTIYLPLEPIEKRIELLRRELTSQPMTANAD